MSAISTTIKTATCKEEVFRFCIQSERLENFPESLTLEKGLRFKNLPLSEDQHGLLKAGRDRLTFYFDPPTGSYKLNHRGEETLSGFVQPGYPEPPVLLIRLGAEDTVHGFGAACAIAPEGCQEIRLLNRRNGDGDDHSSSFPFFMIRGHSQVRGVFINCSYPLRILIDREGQRPEGPAIRIEMETHPGEIGFDVFIFRGDPARILDLYTQITGRPFLPPVWALGYHQAGPVRSEQIALRMARRIRQEAIPCDVIHIDEAFRDNHRIFSAPATRFPNPEKLNDELSQMDIRTIVTVEPGILKEEGYSIYEQGRAGNYFCQTPEGSVYTGKNDSGLCVFPDFSHEPVREWWADCCRDLLRAGTEGFLNENNEPVLKKGKNYNPLQENILHNRDCHTRIRNIYANLQAQATIRAFRKHEPSRRPFILSRAGFCGIQKHAALLLGSRRGNGNGLRESLLGVLNLGLSGVPLVAIDNGGGKKHGFPEIWHFSRKKEIMLRRLELASLLPIFRLDDSRREGPWEFDREYLDSARKHIRRRYRLVFYLYSLVHESVRTGAPLVRPLFYHYPHIAPDRGRDQFLLGSDLLAAPVLEEGRREREVYLPPGTWYEFESGKSYSGDEEIVIPAPPGYYPLFIRGGAILPVGESAQHMRAGLDSEVKLEIYPARHMSGNLVLDDCGISHDPEHYFQQDFLAERDESGDISFRTRVSHDGYQPPHQEVELRLPGNYPSMIRGDRKIEGRQIRLTNEDRSLEMFSFSFPLNSEPVRFPYRPGRAFAAMAPRR